MAQIVTTAINEDTADRGIADIVGILVWCIARCIRHVSIRCGTLPGVLMVAAIHAGFIRVLATERRTRFTKATERSLSLRRDVRIAVRDTRGRSDSATEPSTRTPADVAAIEKQLRVLQWITPLLTAVVIGIGSLMGEQQRPAQLARGAVKKAAGKVLDTVRN